MTIQDHFEQQLQLTTRHTAQHLSNINPPTTVDHSCRICYPPPLVLPPAFQNFWNWISNYFFAVSYTSYTIRALPIFCQAFQLDNNRIKGLQVLILSSKLLFSIRYQQRPDSIRNLVFFFFNLTHRTNYFNNPVTPQLVAQLNTDIQTERNNNPNNLIDNPPVYNQNMADEAAITNALQTVFGNNAANLLSRGSNIAKIEPFSGKEDEDPIEWLAIFEKAAATNGWTTPERKLAVAASYLRGAASDWYDTNSATIGNHWESGQNTGNNFTDLFKKYFANDTRKNKWYQELLTLRQGSNETVDDYAAKFQRLLKRVDTTNAIPDAQKIRMFLFGLTPTITPMVHLQDANTLSDVIGNARKVETGLNYAHLGPSVTGIATKVATVSTTPAKTESPQMEAIEALTQQMQKLSLNYANLSSALLAQTQPIQPQPVRRIQPARYTQPNNLTQTFRPNRPRTDIRDIECYRCGEKGHYARDCMSERNARRPQRRDAHYLETYEETYDSYDNYYEDEYYQDYYDDNYEEAEAYVTTRSRSQPTTNYRPKPKQPRAVENIISSESQQEQRLRRPQPRQNINIPMDEVIETTATPAVPPKRTVKRTPRMPSIIEQMPPYRISDDILNMPSSAKIGQLLKYNDQKKDFARILRRPPKTQETNYVDRISDSEEGDTRDTTAVKCAVRIKGDPVYAILDSGAAVCVITKSLARKLRLEITKPSNTIVVTADGTRNRALGQIEKVPIVIQTLLIPTTFHVIDSKDETLLLGTDWFRRTRAVLDFNNKSVQLTFLAKTILAPISIHIGEVPRYVSFQEEEIDNEIDEIFDEYEYEDDLIEKEIHLLNSESSEDEEIWEQWYQQPLNYNPWDEKEEIPDQYNLLEDILNDYLTEDDEDKTDNPALFLAQAEKGNEWNIQKDLHVGPLTDHQQTQFQQVLNNNEDICAKSQTDIGRTGLIKHQIHTGDAAPQARSPYRTNPKKKEFLREEIKKLEQQGMIKKSMSPWAAPVVIVDKKGGDLRMCVDYRPLNKVTKPDAYPLPRIDDLLESFRTANWFSTLDLASGFWQVEMDPKDKEKTAFITDFGLYEFNVMPFGLRNAPGTFQRLMNYVLQEFLGKFVAVYLDDIIIYSKTFEQHLDNITQVFQALRNANLKIKLKKCYFCLPSIAFLGHIVGRDGIRVDPSKIEKIRNFPAPTSVTEIRSVLGLFSYYRKFIKDFSKIAKPISKLLQKETPFQWTEKQQKAFEHLKERLISAPILRYPDFEQPFILYTDASGTGLGAVLSQKDKEGKEYVVAYASRSLNKHEQNYAVTDLECLAIVWAINYFQHYLGLLPFSVVTDHSALKWLQTSKIPTGRRARWIMQLQQYDFTIQHRAGKANANADALSRINPTEEPINSAECFLAIIGEEKNIYEVQNDGYSRPQRIPKKFNIIQPEFKPEYLINEPFWEHSQRKYRFNFFSHLY